MKNMESTWDICITSYDVYNVVCSRLVELCPRLVPSPLWGLSLARIARMAPQAALAICDYCPEIVERIHHYWMSLDRSSVCEVCGRPGNEIDEDWLYCVFDENGNLVSDIAMRIPTPEETRRYKGVAYLQRLRLLCEKCHLAKHQGYALVHGRNQEALEHLARINQLSLEEAKELVDKAFTIHNELSKIRDWTIKMGELEGLDEELRRKVEELLNNMYRKGFFIYGTWFYYQYPKYYEEVEPRIIYETMTVIDVTLKKSVTTSVEDDEWIESLLKTIKGELEPNGIRVLSHEFKLFMRYLLENEKQRKLLQIIVDYASKDKIDNRKGILYLILDGIGLTGKWIVFVPTRLYPRIFRYVLDALEKKKLAYQAKITLKREEFNTRKELPIIVYVPVAFATHYIVEVAKVMKNILDKFNVSKRMFFKPDLFTEKGVYSGKANHRPYIYVY